MSKTSDNIDFVSLFQHRANQRGEKLVVDGHGGPVSTAVLNRILPDLAVKAVVPAVVSADSTNSAKHYALALPYKGIKEQAGSGTHPSLIPMFDLTPSWLPKDDSVTAWCGIFRGWLGHKAGTGIPADHYRAKEWAKWGKAVDKSKPSTWHRGDTIVMKRTGGFHVCLLDRVEGSFAYCLGGNQSNSVNVTKFAISEILNVRR